MKKYFLLFIIIFLSCDSFACLSKMMSEEALEEERRLTERNNKEALKETRETIQYELNDWREKKDYNLVGFNQISSGLNIFGSIPEVDHCPDYKWIEHIGISLKGLIPEPYSNISVDFLPSKDGAMGLYLLHQYRKTYLDVKDYFDGSLGSMHFGRADLEALRKSAASVLRFTRITDDFLTVLYENVAKGEDTLIDMEELLRKNPPIVYSQLNYTHHK